MVQVQVEVEVEVECVVSRLKARSKAMVKVEVEVESEASVEKGHYDERGGDGGGTKARGAGSSRQSNLVLFTEINQIMIYARARKLTRDASLPP